MNILGIETSCDETAAAVVQPDGTVLSNIVASQIAEHAPYGGVVPELASRAHLRAIAPVIEQAIAPLPDGLQSVDAIAVTQGPGLVGALLVGLETAKALAVARNLPVVGVNHLEGHLFAVYLRFPNLAPPPPTPFVALLASGGHTALYRVEGPGEIQLLGQTRDDAAGECFDKGAKLMGLDYPGGPEIDRLATLGDPSAVDLPRPMSSRAHLDFSFSGLKTALARHVSRQYANTHPVGGELHDLCASLQHRIVDVLAKKSIAACQKQQCAHLVLSGGVAANQGLRRRTAELAAVAGVQVHVPPIVACTDNAAMIAYAGAARLVRGESDAEIVAYSRDPDRRRGKFRRDGSLVRRRATGGSSPSATKSSATDDAAD